MPHFVDTNVVVYAFSDDERMSRASGLLDNAVASVQVLNELTNLARRKWSRSWQEIDLMVARATSAFGILVPVDEQTHIVGRYLAERYRLQVYDSFIVAAALLAGCDTLYSEDMQDRLVIEKRLTIRNPFA